MKDLPILMTFGRYKGLDIGKVSSSYLVWAYENIEQLEPRIKNYIKENLDWIQEDAMEEHADEMEALSSWDRD